MQKRWIVLMFLLLLTGSMVYAQDSTSMSDATVATIRNKQIHDLLDYRFRGGFYAFERLFLQTVKYTPQARQYCIIGITVLSFQVSCDGTLHDIKIKNPLHYGLDEQLTKFLKATKGQWNLCHNNKYTRFSVPIQFTMKGTKTDSIDPVITFTGNNPGYVCSSDNYYLQKAKEALAKKKGKRAQDYIEVLIKRNPFNNEYYNMMKQAMDYSKKGKKKKKKK